MKLLKLFIAVFSMLIGATESAFIHKSGKGLTPNTYYWFTAPNANIFIGYQTLASARGMVFTVTANGSIPVAFGYTDITKQNYVYSLYPTW